MIDTEVAEKRSPGHSGSRGSRVEHICLSDAVCPDLGVDGDTWAVALGVISCLRSLTVWIFMTPSPKHQGLRSFPAVPNLR